VKKCRDKGKGKQQKTRPSGNLTSCRCDVYDGAACGFKVRSHDEKELTDIVIAHAKSAHNKDVTASDVKAMMKIASPKKSKTT